MPILRNILFFSFLVLSFTIATAFKPESKKKVVLIIGASRGVGLATAELLTKKGYIVYATVRDENLPSTASSNIHFEILDVTAPLTIHKTVDKIIKEQGYLDILINNDAYALVGPLEGVAIEEIYDQMDVNFIGVIRVCQEVLPHMRRQNTGHILNISSELGAYGLPYGSIYTASKSALESFSEALSIELLPWNIVVSIIEPGLISTKFSIKMGSRKLSEDPYQKVIGILENSLQQREEQFGTATCQTPEEIAQFLYHVIEEPKPQLRYQTSDQAGSFH